MGFKSSTTFLLHTFISFLLFSTNHLVLATTHAGAGSRPKREALGVAIGGGGIIIGGGGGIIIGGGGGGSSPSSPSPAISPNCAPPPPPPPPCLPRSSPSPPRTDSRIMDAANAIKRFKSSITCDPFGITKTWVGDNPCNYKGFRCTCDKKTIYGVLFNGYQLAVNCGINDLIKNLPDLSLFHANSNNFTGTLPNFNKRAYFYELDLSNNNFHGEFPLSVLEATNLTFLDLRFNFFTGRVPPQVFNLQLLALFLNNNQFEQEFPDNLGQIPFITLANNKFHGPIPKSIGLAANSLLEILLLNNELSGCLPYEIGLLKKARVFDVEGNYLTGPIPHSFSCLGDIQYLIMSRNKLYGPVPESVCTLPKLVNLTLGHNYFTQVGPQCMKLIQKKVLDVKDNCILGLPNQKSPEECDSFFKQPKYCPEAHMYKNISCKCSAPYQDSKQAAHPQPTVSYAALSPKYK